MEPPHKWNTFQTDKWSELINSSLQNYSTPSLQQHNCLLLFMMLNYSWNCTFEFSFLTFDLNNRKMHPKVLVPLKVIWFNFGSEKTQNFSLFLQFLSSLLWVSGIMGVTPWVKPLSNQMYGSPNYLSHCGDPKWSFHQFSKCSFLSLALFFTARHANTLCRGSLVILFKYLGLLKAVMIHDFTLPIADAKQPHQKNVF